MNHRIQSALVALISFSATASAQSADRGLANPAPSARTAAADVRSPMNESLTDAQILGILDAANGGEVEQGKIAEAKDTPKPSRTSAR